MSAKVVSVANRKGGVGKTTLTLSLAEGLAALKKQSPIVRPLELHNSTFSVLMTGGIPRADERTFGGEGKTIVDLIEDRSRRRSHRARASFYISKDVLDHEPGKAISLLSGDRRLLGIERRLLSKPSSSLSHVTVLLEEVVDSIIAEQSEFFDVIIFDCPPGFSLVTDVALRRSDLVMLPTSPTLLASQGILAYVQCLTEDLQVADAASKTHVFLTRQIERKHLLRSKNSFAPS